MKKLLYAESIVRVEESLSREFGFAVGVVAALIPHRVGAVCVRPDGVGNIREDKLRFLVDSV